MFRRPRLGRINPLIPDKDSDSDEIQVSPVKKQPVKRMTKRRKKAKYSSEEEESTTEEEDEDEDEDENEVAGSSKPKDPVGELCEKFPKVPRGDITRSMF